MTEIKETWIKLRHDDADEKIVGHFIVANGILKMCTPSGVPTGAEAKLWPNDDEGKVARGLIRQRLRWRKASA
jgi:hypothetical protein